MGVHGDNLAQIESIAHAVHRLQFMQRGFAVADYHTDKRRQIHVVDNPAAAPRE
jgi:hypothetical protein